MSFEFDLVPSNPSGRFSDAVLAEMRAWWDRFPTAAAPDGTLMVFASDEIHELRIEQQKATRENDYLTSEVVFANERVVLSCGHDLETRRWLYDFAVEARHRWNGVLQYFGEPVPPEDLLADA